MYNNANSADAKSRANLGSALVVFTSAIFAVSPRKMKVKEY
jgi:hypothetical protein